MKSEKHIEDMRNILGALVEMSAADDNGPFDPNMVQTMAAVWNALCFILEDGSPHAATFQSNWDQLINWCAEYGVRFIKFDPTVKQ